MKKLAYMATALSTFLLLSSAMAQRPGSRDTDRRDGQQRDRQGQRSEEDRRGLEGRGRLGPPPNLLIMALDADRNGEISTDEIKNAVAALKTLDKNGDGKLTREELRPEGFPDGGPDGRARGRGGPGGGAADFVRRMMSRDTNGDGKISGDEIPPFMAERLGQLDTNGDKAIDKKELEQAAQRFGRRDGDGGSRPSGRDADGGGRPNRPDRPKRPGSDS